MGQIIDFNSHRAIDESKKNSYVSYDPEMQTATEIFIDLDKFVLLAECWVPLRWDVNGIVVLIDDLRDEEKKAAIRTALRTEWVIFKVGRKEDIEVFIHRSFSQLEIDEFLSAAMAGSKPIDGQFLLNTIIADAHLRSASEVHFKEVTPDEIRVLFLMEGLLREYMTLPDDAADDIVNRIKSDARLDMEDNDLTKIGHIKFKHDGLPEFQLRVTTELSEGTSEYIVIKILHLRDT